MLKFFIVLLAGLIPMFPAVIYFWRERKNQAKAANGLLWGLKGFNVVVGLMAFGIGILWLASPSTVMAMGLTAQAAAANPYGAIGAGISTGFAAVGAGIAVSGTGAAAIGAIAEKPEAFGRSLIFVGLAEGIAIYGLIISFLILQQR